MGASAEINPPTGLNRGLAGQGATIFFGLCRLSDVEATRSTGPAMPSRLALAIQTPVIK